MKKIYAFVACFIYAATVLHAAITGDTVVCSNEIVTYSVPSGGANYNWTVTGGNVLLGVNTNTATIQWGLTGNGTIVVTQTSPVQTHVLNVVIHPIPSPAITHPPYTTCPPNGGSSGVPQGDRDDPCEKVCKGYTVTYSTPLVAGNTYTWLANGHSNITTAGNTATVTWDTTAFGWIMVVETNIYGCSDSFRLCVEKINLPVASFTHQANACKFSSVLFNNTSTGINSYQWYFGDGGSSSLTNPTHAYNSAGSYTITLIATNSCGCVDTFQSMINIDSLPGPDITCIETVCAFDTATYSTTPGAGCVYTWMANGGTIVAGQGTPNVTVAWGAGQIGSLGLVVTGCGAVCSDTTYAYIPIVPATAVINGPHKVCAGDCATFTLPRFSGAGYTWTLNSNCGGVISDTVCCEQVEICYPPFANCNDTLNVAYFDTFLGCGGNAQHVIRVRPHLQIIGNTIVCANTNASFNGFAIGVGPVVCQWSVSPVGPVLFPGGPAPSVSINWNNIPGTYVLTAIPVPPLQVCDDSVKIIVTVVAPPSAPVIIGDTVVCANSTVQYCSSSGSLISWIITGGTPTTASGNCVTVNWGSIPPFIVRAYQTAQNSPFCNSDTTVQSITPVLSIPTPAIVSTSPICANGTNSFSTTTLYPNSATYTWSISPSINGAVITGQGTSTCTVEWGNNAPSSATVTLVVTACGQTASNFANVTLNSPPNPSVVQVGSLCAGGTAQLQASGGVSYQWSGPSGQSNANPLTITTKGLYSVTVTAANGCTALTQINVQYVSGPTASISTLNYVSYCIGSPYTVNICALGNPNYAYNWNVGGPNTQCRNFSSPGAYSVVVTDVTNNCTALSNIIVVSEDSCNGGGPGTCIYNGQIDFTHTSCNPIQFTNTSVNSTGNYIWNFGDFSGSSLVSPTHSYAQAGFYVVYLTGYVYNANQTDSCLVRDTAQIEIPVVALFDFKSKCYNDSVCFTDKSTFTAGNSITSWNWNFGDATTSTQQHPCHVYGAGGNYFVTLIVSNGICSDTIIDTVMLAPRPTAAFSFSNPNCVNNAVQFTDGSFSNINYWSWTFGDGGTSLNQNPQHSYSLPGIYIDTLIVRDTTGCADTTVKSISISAPVNYGSIWASDTLVCAGTPVLLVAPACGTCTYLWSTGSTNDSITVNSSGVYSVDLNDGSGCIYTTTISIIVDNGPPSVIQNTGDDELCVGESTTLFVQPNINWTYLWISNDPSINGLTSSGVLVFGNIPGVYTYQVLVIDTTTGCGDTSLPYIVVVNPNPVPPIIAPLSPTTVCAGDTITLLGSHPDPTVTYLWNTGSVNDTLLVTKNGCYTLEVTDTNSCTSFNIFCVTVNPLPDLCTFYEGCFDTCAPYMVCAPAGNSWQWLNSGIPMPGDTLQCLTTSMSGVYSVIVTNSFGCVDTTGDLDLTLYPCPDSLCADFWIDSVACDSNGNHVLYYHVANQSQVPVTQVNIEILQPHLSIPIAPAVVFTTIPSQSVSQQLSTTIYNANAGDSLCFRAHILAYDSMGHELVCCYSDTDCIVLDTCGKHPVDTVCCYFNFLNDTVRCIEDPVAPYYTFSWQIDGCGTLSIQGGNNIVVNGSNPLVLTGNVVTITGTYTPSGPADTIMCATFVMSQGNVYCADTTICFNMSCDSALPPPTPVCDLNFEDSICVGQATTYTYGGNPAGLTFQWQFSNGSPATASGPGPHSVTYSTPGCHQVICIVNSANTTLDCIDTICVMPPPVATVSQNGNALYAYPSGYNYQWYSGTPANNTIISGATNQFYVPSGSPGFYCVVVSNGPTCRDTACTDFEPTGIDGLGQSVWNIYPNPNDGAFTLQVNSAVAESIELKVANAIGELVDIRNYETHAGEQHFYISNTAFATGVYFIYLKTNKGLGVKRMVVK